MPRGTKGARAFAGQQRGIPTPAARPLVSVLDCGKLERVFGLRLPPWQTALKLAMENF
jgi:dTDP-4-dehydrorhamnose reductase